MKPVTKIMLSCFTFASMMSMAGAQNLAIVNGKPVPLSRQHFFEQQMQQQGQVVDDNLRQKIKEEIITREMFVQEAQRQGIHQQAIYREQMELARQGILIRLLMEKVQHQAQSMTDEQLRAEYEKIIKSRASQQYRSSHILFKTEQEAQSARAQLRQNPRRFAQLAQQLSLDVGSKKQGGDLGWVDPAMFVPEFSKAMIQLQKGQISEPIKTRFGWHLIYLTDVRGQKFPPFESIKEELRQEWVQNHLSEFQKKVRASARVQ